MKKTLIFVILVIAIVGKLSAEEWNIIDVVEHEKFFDIDAYDSLNYSLVGEHNIVEDDEYNWYTFIKTSTDAGETWKVKWQSKFSIPDNMFPMKILEVEQISKNTIIAGTEFGLILKTTDGGMSWDTTDFGIKRDTSSSSKFGYCSGLSFLNNKLGAAFFYAQDFISITDDSGKSWEKIHIPEIIIDEKSLKIAPKIKRLSDSTILLLEFILDSFVDETKTSWIIYTTDKGASWDYFKESDNCIYSMDFANDKIGFIGGHKAWSVDRTPIIKKTTDGGLTWNIVYEGDEQTPYMNALHCVNENVIYGLGSTQIIKSTDGGETWENQSYEYVPDSPLENVAFGSQNTGIVSTRIKYIYSNSLSVGVDDKETIQDYDLKIYPNPSYSNSRGVKFKNANDSYIQIDINNKLGVTIDKIYSGYRVAGEHTLQYTPETSLASGTYWITMTINGEKRIAKPLVILR